MYFFCEKKMGGMRRLGGLGGLGGLRGLGGLGEMRRLGDLGGVRSKKDRQRVKIFIFLYVF